VVRGYLVDGDGGQSRLVLLWPRLRHTPQRRSPAQPPQCEFGPSLLLCLSTFRGRRLEETLLSGKNSFNLRAYIRILIPSWRGVKSLINSVFPHGWTRLVAPRASSIFRLRLWSRHLRYWAGVASPMLVAQLRKFIVACLLSLATFFMVILFVFESNHYIAISESGPSSFQRRVHIRRVSVDSHPLPPRSTFRSYTFDNSSILHIVLQVSVVSIKR
jgi:hypothetical protein